METIAGTGRHHLREAHEDCAIASVIRARILGLLNTRVLWEQSKAAGRHRKPEGGE